MNPTEDVFGDRRRALEDAFFRDRDNELLERLKLEMEAEDSHRHLAQVSGILDEKLIASLVKTGVRADTLAALSLIPLVEVAWSDGAISPEERNAVLAAAAENGVPTGSASHELLSRWLVERPDVRLVNAWKDYVGALKKAMPPDAVASLKSQLVARCQRVAASAGGFLGMGKKVSQTEQATIEQLARAFG